MNIVAFVAQKGGAGKSTLACNLAVAAYLAGERVFICDLDPVQSLVKWSRARKSLDIPVAHIPPRKLDRALETLKKEGVTFAVIDTPGADSDYSASAIPAADFCVIPARPNVLDLWASEITLAKVKAKRKDFAFLLNQCPPAQQSARVARGAKSLQDMGALLSPMVSSRVDYQEAIRLGLGVCELRPNGHAAREMSQLWISLSGRLRDRAAAQGGRTPERRSSGEDFAPYRELFDQALKMGGVYADFLNALLPFDRAGSGRSVQPPPAGPEGEELKKPQAGP